MNLFKKKAGTQAITRLEAILKKTKTTLELIDLKTQSLYSSIEELNAAKDEIINLYKSMKLESESNTQGQHTESEIGSA